MITPPRPRRRTQVTLLQALAFLDLRLLEPGDLEAACRRCGCTNLRACPGGCEWTEPDLCSACAPAVAATP